MYSWPPGPWFRVNLVLGPNGQLAGADGSSASLTSPNDRHILKLIRSRADVVIVGAQSIRREGWHLPPHGTMGVVTRSELPAGCPDPERVVTGSLDEILTLTTAESHRLSEGGARVVQGLLERRVVDELCLTMTGANHPRQLELPEWMTLSSSERWRVTQTLSDGKNAFTTWRRATP